MRLFLALLFMVAIVGCASAPTQWAPASDYDLAITDNTAEQHFDFAFTSKSAAPLCLSQESWPAIEGLPAGVDGATLTTANGKKALLPTGSAYCPGGCGEVRIEPSQSVSGAIPYLAFGDADTIAVDDSRALAFTVQPYVCSM